MDVTVQRQRTVPGTLKLTAQAARGLDRGLIPPTLHLQFPSDIKAPRHLIRNVPGDGAGSAARIQANPDTRELTHRFWH